MPETIGYPEKLSKRPRKEIVDALTRARHLLQQGKDEREARRHQAWRQSERQYRGDHWDQTKIDDPLADLITVNMSFSTVNTIVPYITGASPSFIVEPYSEDANIRSAKAQEAFLNRLWQSQDVDGQKVLHDSAVDALIYGDGYVKVGFGIDERQTDDGLKDVANLWVRRISPWDIWIDPTANGITDARWVCQRNLVPKRELQTDPRYYNTTDELLTTATDTPEDSDRQINLAPTESDIDLVEVYEFYDLVDRTLIVFTDAGNVPLRYVKEITIPIVPIENYRDPSSPYHLGELEQLWPLQQELNKTRSQQATHRRRNVSKLIAREGLLDQSAINALQSGKVNDVAFVSTPESLQDIIQPLSLPPLTGDVYAMSDQVTRDLYEISGVNEYLRGATPQVRRTATEATIIEGASNVKTADKLRMVERAARKIGTLLLHVAKDVFPETDYDEVGLYLTGRQAERVNRADRQQTADELVQGGDIAGAEAAFNSPLGGAAVVQPSEDMWVGKYEVMVEEASTELRNPVLRAQKYREMLTTMAQIAPMAGVQVNFKRLMELWLEAEGIDDIDAIFEVQAPPMAPPAMGIPDGGTAAGDPNMANAQPPVDQPNPFNSGMMLPTS